MSVKRKGKWWVIDFTDKQQQTLKKVCSAILLVLIIFGYGFYIVYNIFIGFSANELIFNNRIEVQDFSESNRDNRSIEIDGTILVKNDFWYSIEITDLEMKFRLFTDEGLRIDGFTITKDRIDRGERAEIPVNIEFSFEDLGVDFLALNATKYLEAEITISFFYGVYGISLAMESEIEMEGTG